MHADEDPLAALFLADDPQAVQRAASLVATRSHGRVRKPETIHRRTGKPERDGLFCARIFGPVADLQCLCGKLSGPEADGKACDRCGVLCGSARLRGERWGHIESPAPLVHPLLAPAVARALGCTTKQLQALLNFEARLDSDGAVVKIDEQGFADVRGVWAIAEQLAGRHDALLLTHVPVTPPAWRGTRSDPQDAAYMQLVNRCNRLDRLIELNAPEIILNNEARMAQTAFAKLYATVRAELAARGPVVVAPVDERSDELLAAVYDDPDDNTPRRAYAAHLTDHGDPRGEFIKLQLASVTGGRRGADLLRRNFDRWLAPLDAKRMTEVVFRRGFPAACKVTAAAEDAKLGEPAWATLEHLDSELVELICDPVLRGLRSLALGWKAMHALCEGDCVLPRVTALVLRLSRCPPLASEAVTRCDALPGLHTLTLVHRTNRGAQDWRWLSGTPLAHQLERLTLVVAFDRIDKLGLQWWVEFMQQHPRLTRLDIKLGTRHLTFELRRDGDWMTLRVAVSNLLLEYVSVGESEIPQQLGGALTDVDPHGVALSVECRYRLWGEQWATMVRRLRDHFGPHAKLPAADWDGA